MSFRVATSVIKKVKKLSGGIDQYLLTTPNDLLLYKKAIQIKKNIIRIHERVAAGLPINPNYRAAHLLGASADDAPEVLVGGWLAGCAAGECVRSRIAVRPGTLR